MRVNKPWIAAFTRSPQYALIKLAFVAIATTMWYINPRLGWWPFLIAILPVLPQLLIGRFTFPRTPFDIPIIIFIITAGVGIWASYDRQAAWAKFWLLIAAVLLFYTIAHQPAANHWILATLFTVLGFSVAMTFLLTHNFTEYPIKFPPVYRVGLWLMSLRPSISIPGIHPNAAASVIAMMLPFLFALGIRVWREKKITLLVLVALASIIMSMGLLLSSSRGVLLAILVALAIWALWGLSKLLANISEVRQGTIFPLFLILSIMTIIVLAISYPGGAEGLANLIPGPASAGSRLDLVRAGLSFIQDYPFTGAGLKSFPGLYSQYILVIPYLVIDHGHNILFDIGVDQGLFGLIAFAIIFFGGALYLLLKASTLNPLRPTLAKLLSWSALASLVVISTHGLVDDVIYDYWGAPLLFVIPGYAVSIAQNGYPQLDRRSNIGIYPLPSKSFLRIGIILIVVGLLFTAYRFRNQIQAQWFANLGAVHMTRVELDGWPINQWDDGSNAGKLISAERYLQEALAYNPDNRTANHRLGLIAMVNRDYATAVTYLESAADRDQNHPGINKTLGYSYLWANQPKKAHAILSELPEARQELGVYVWWWGTLGRADLADTAQAMLDYFKAPDTD